MAIFFSSWLDPLETTNQYLTVRGGGVNIRMRNPRDFSGETLNVVLLALQNILRNKKGERAVLDTKLLDLLVQEVLNLLPNEV
jgi:hypothetical protein